MKVTQGTDETYIAMEGTSSNLGCNVLLLPLRATLLVIWTLKHGQIWIIASYIVVPLAPYLAGMT